MASERCAKCGHAKYEHFNGVGLCDALNRDCGLDCKAFAPAPREAGAVPTAAWRDLGYEGPLSQEEVVAALDRLGGHSPEGAAIEITVRALRAEVERLKAEHAREQAFHIEKFQHLRDSYDAEKARADRLAEALREIIEEDGPTGRDIARAALKREEE